MPKTALTTTLAACQPYTAVALRRLFHQQDSCCKKTASVRLQQLLQRDLKNLIVMAKSVANSENKSVVQRRHVELATTYYKRQFAHE